MIDLSVLGVKELERDMRRLEDRVQKKIVRAALREHARKHVKPRILQHLSGNPVGVDTGTLRAAFQRSGVRSGARRGQQGVIRIGVVWPDPAELGIASTKVEGYYPTAVEYGHRIAGSSDRVPAYPYLRPAIDKYVRIDRKRIAKLIGRRIEDEWKR